jgi:hypothetical protein
MVLVAEHSTFLTRPCQLIRVANTGTVGGSTTSRRQEGGDTGTDGTVGGGTTTSRRQSGGDTGTGTGNGVGDGLGGGT